MENTVQQIDHFETIMLESKILAAEIEATQKEAIERCKAIIESNNILLTTLNN
jgi:hypothetical protein